MKHARTAQPRPAGRSPAALAASRGRPTAQLLTPADSPRMLAQLRSLQGLMGATLQRQGPDEEEPLQGRFNPVQRASMEEEEPMQGRFAKPQLLQMAGEEEELQMLSAPVQRAGPEEEEPLQGRFTPAQLAGMDEEEPLQGRFAKPVQAKEDPGQGANRTGMPDGLKAGAEALSGMDLSGVRVHANSSKPQQLGALAYAQGNDIHLGPGQEAHLPHEAWHVVQQRQGRVQATMQMAGVAVNDDVGLEHEADVMGAKAAHIGASAKDLKPRSPNSEAPSATLQRVAQMEWSPTVYNSARKHYNDGWGDAYGITDDATLEGVVYEDGATEEGTHNIDLGKHQNSNEYISKTCNVAYTNYAPEGESEPTHIFHCGPSDRGR